MEVTRTFDLKDWGNKVCPREVMFGGKHGNNWVTYSSEAVRERENVVDKVAGVIRNGVSSILRNLPKF